MRFAVCSSFLSGGLDASGGLASPSETIAQLKAQNVEAIEAPPNFFLDTNEAAIEAAAQAFRDAGIVLRSVHAPFGGENNLSHLDAAKRRGAIETHKRVLQRATDALLTHGQLTLNGWLARCPQCGHQLFGTTADAFCLYGESKPPRAA
ncbi:MAG: hypothetical protein NZT92_10180 [Abditibacteriales bacterium]|nr:hypothetical protein [Abditibacteriales bacterium]MDW8367256.1 hypothetical protein [Abditibacteriales bacterium]